MDKETKDEVRGLVWEFTKLGVRYAAICFVVYFILGFLEGLVTEASKLEDEETCDD